MKKLLAVLLSVVMTMCLTVPALAAPAPGASGEEAAALGAIGGADGPTAIITSGPINPEDFNWDGYDLEGLDAADWVEQLDQQARAYRDELKKSLGGVPGQVGVMVNGKYVQFPDAVPELRDGCAMVPIRALAEVLGGQVAYGEEEKEQLVKAADKTYLSFSVGNPQVTVEYPSGSGELVTLSCAPYIKDGRAYVPVRFMGEILGYEVGWDADYQTAILLDRDDLAAEIDKNFTILNRVQASQALSLESGKSFSTEMKGSVTVTAFDTLNGNKTYTADLTGKTLLNAEAVSGAYSVTLSDNIAELLLEQAGLDGEDAEMVRATLRGLKDMQVIMTREGKFWVHAPALDEIGGEKNIWVGYDMGLDPELMETLFAGTGASTMGTVIAALAKADSVTEWAGVTQAVEFMSALYGDENFTTSNGVSTLAIGPDQLAAVSGIDAAEMKEALKEFRITMKVDDKGGAAVTCRMETAAQAGTPTIRMTVDCTQSGGKAELTMTVHVANLGEAVVEFTAGQKSTGEKPMTEPPEGAAVVDAAQMLD